MQATIRMTPELVEAMAISTGDFSSIHMDNEFARLSRYRRRVVHGMLPVALAFMIFEAHKSDAVMLDYLSKLSARFHNPIFIDDELRVTLEYDSIQKIVNFEVRRTSDNSIATLGWFAFGELKTLRSNQGPQKLFTKNLTQNSLLPHEIVEGVEDSLDFIASDSCTIAWLAHLPKDVRAKFGEGLVDPNFSLALTVSTLIGMRLPGRFGTFIDLHANFFESTRNGDSINLSGKVKNISSATNRVKLLLSWSNNNCEVGSGCATAMVIPIQFSSIPMSSVQAASSFGVAGRVALITGASRGIGEATAKLLALLGVRVVVHYLHGKKDAENIVKDIKIHGGDAFSVRADLNCISDIDFMFDFVEMNFGKVDILINNAVMQFIPKPIESTSRADFLNELDVTLFGMHQCCIKAIPHMKAQSWGKIINLGTVATENPVSGQNVYISSKSAVIGYTRSLAVELASSNIQVNMVMPKMTKTSLLNSIPLSLINKITNETITGRLLEPLEVAKVIAFLVSEWSNPIVGQRIVLNQGEVPYL